MFITTAGSVKKVRNKYERICELKVSSAKNPKDTYMGKISMLYKLSKMSGVEVKERVAAGIGYEKMQVDNLDDYVSEMLSVSGHKPLPLFIGGKDTGIDIDGGAKVSGNPKADFSLDKGGTPVFWVSYKHGEYYDSKANNLKVGKKVPFQQYGSMSSFFDKNFEQKTGVKGLNAISTGLSNIGVADNRTIFKFLALSTVLFRLE